MLRADFDNHPLWDSIERVEAQLGEILEDGELSEQPNIERIKAQIGYVRSFDVVASTRAAFFTPQMLLAVKSIWDQVLNSLDVRISNGVGYANYVAQAADQAESAVEAMAPWPRPYGRGGEVSQMNTLFEELLEAQRVSIEALEARHTEFREEIERFREETSGLKTDSDTVFEALTTQIESSGDVVEEQKTAVTKAIEAAEERIEELVSENEESFNTWAEAQQRTFLDKFDPLKADITQKLSSADREYASLLKTKESYEKLVSAIAADEVASAFKSEALWTRVAGIISYALGILLLAAAATPLVLLLIEYEAPTESASFDWTPLIIRLAIGVLAGSAATVAIRLGARFFAAADSSKRM